MGSPLRFVIASPISWYGNEQMARKLCLQNRTQLVDFCPGRVVGIGNCLAHSELAKLEGSYEKSD